MKLAEALAIRKTLNQNVKAALAIPPNLEMRANIPASEGTSLLEAQLRAQQKSPTWAAMSLLHYHNALMVVDCVIHDTNRATEVALPKWTFLPHAPAIGDRTSEIAMGSLSEAVLLRKRLEAVHKTYSLLNAVKAKNVTVSRVARSGGGSEVALDVVTLTCPAFNVDNLATDISNAAHALRIVNSVVQEKNWATEVDLPEWVTQAPGTELFPLRF